MLESRMDPAFENAGLSSGEMEEMHPAAGMQVQNSGVTILAADLDPADAPEGWELNNTLGRWIDPKDPETWGKVPRNAACPCNSGKKYKHCHGGAN